METFSLCSEPFSQSNFEGLQIRPVHLDSSKASPIPQHILNYIIKNLEPPKFSGNASDWIQFREDWDYYLAKLSAVYDFPDGVKVYLLENCLDDVNQRQLRMDQKKGRFTLY
jgi:hypothetical protein